MKKAHLIYFLLNLVFVSQVVNAKNFYRYTNKEGRVEIKDQINQEMEKLGYDVINEMGKLVRHVEPSKTLAELEQDRLKKIELRNEEIRKNQQISKDADLLRQFTSVGDIIRNRDSQLLALEQRIRIQNSKASLLRLQLEDQQTQAATYERLGQKVAKSLADDIQASRDQIASNIRNTELLEKEKVRVEKSFERDIIRYKDLESLRLTLRKEARKLDGTEPVIYNCPDNQTCNRAWQLAQIYARDNATGKIEIITNTLILTSRPEEDTHIAVSFSRIPAPDNKMQIVLELSCTNTEQGVNHCKTPAVKGIRKGYLSYIKDRLN
ncbi:MAG: hypothetical protein ACPGJI_01945 [Kangiellaceae bacterium]